MTAAELIHSLTTRGVQLSAGPDGALSVKPRSAVTPELREALRVNKEAVLQLLQPQSFDDVRSGVKRLEKQLEGEEDITLFLLVIEHDKESHAPADLEQRLTERARSRGLRGRIVLVAHSSLDYDPWAVGNPWPTPKGNGHDPHVEGSNPHSQGRKNT